MFTGFKQLGTGINRRPWWQVLGVQQGAGEGVAREAYRTLAKQHHPDAGGDGERFREIQMAWEESGYK
jgi:curved DNA-binding protein CbpA